MELSITEFRRNLFSVVQKAMEGDEVWVKTQGRRFRIVPEGKRPDKLSRITPMQIINEQAGGLENTGLFEEMAREWEHDWDRDFGPAPQKKTRPRKKSSRK